ncbi:hypothetical protein [Vibrio coralliirubri]|uniref:hypothetical protein n=1 Tax=Vibrio coralliirubri TaxID=1516159 RepID=UPI000A36F586|nr:hypothetical protein [Vibrio coralliirubri]
MLLVGGVSGLLKSGDGQGRYFDIRSQGERNQWAAGRQVDQQLIWATVAQAMGASVPYSGSTSAVFGIFTNVELNV